MKICTDVLVSQTEIYVEIKLYPNFADIKTVFSAHGCMTYIMWMSLSGYLGLVWLLWPDVNLIFFKICIYLQQSTLYIIDASCISGHHMSQRSNVYILCISLCVCVNCQINAMSYKHKMLHSKGISARDLNAFKYLFVVLVISQ